MNFVFKYKKRIETIIENFLNFACKFEINTDKSKIKNIVQIKLIYTDEKSNKFWNIEYTPNDYKVNYGKKKHKTDTFPVNNNLRRDLLRRKHAQGREVY